MNTEPRVTAEQIAQHLGVVKSTVCRWHKRKGLSAHKIGRLWKFQLFEVDAWVRAGGADGKTADWNEIAKECIVFSNATGGRLLLGIADGRDALPASHQIGVMNRLSDNVRPIGDSWVVEIGRYVGTGPMNQMFLSTTGQLAWAIEGDQSTACVQTKRITTGTTP